MRPSHRPRTEPMEGRLWMAVGEECHEGVRFLSYRLTTREELLAMPHVAMDCDLLRRNAWIEVQSCGADILALQNIDDMKLWREQLASKGYDVVVGDRTQTRDAHGESNAIGIRYPLTHTLLELTPRLAFRREHWQLFRSEVFELNEAARCVAELSSAQRELCLTDDVAVVAFLRPRSQNNFPSALLVSTYTVSDELSDSYCRGLITEFFCRTIESINSDLQLPVVIGVSLGEEPTSRAYSILRTGRRPLAPQPPRKVAEPPRCEFFSRTSCRVSWKTPHRSFAEPLVLGYRLAWKTGGNDSLGFAFEQTVHAGDCIQYKDHVVDGVRKTEVLDEAFCVVTRLASDIPYQFRVLAFNEIGDGAWSDVSDPFVLNNPEQVPFYNFES